MRRTPDTDLHTDIHRSLGTYTCVYTYEHINTDTILSQSLVSIEHVIQNANTLLGNTN